MRSPAYERQWFEEMARAAQRWGREVEAFVDTVGERLEKGRRDYGEDSWADRSLLEIIREAKEEGADVPGWLVLGAQTLSRETSGNVIDSEKATEIQASFLRAAALGLLLHEELRRAEASYRTARAEAEWRRQAVVGTPPPTLYFEE